MTRPRSQQISLAKTPFYHVISRCVRRAYLCGSDPLTGKNFNHRRIWIEDRIRLLSSLFTVDICAYAIMSNHIHLVVRLSPEQATDWSARDVARRWKSLYKGPLIIDKLLSGDTLTGAETETCNDIIALWRKRLTDLSWFMKCLNEPIARQANKEDDCTGHFWEGRFKSLPLPADTDLLGCMAYVDLNPVRAGQSTRPEGSRYTSVKERLFPEFDLQRALASFTQHGGSREAFLGPNKIPVRPLLAFSRSYQDCDPVGIPLLWDDYFTLVNWIGSRIMGDKPGPIPESLSPMLRKLGFVG